MCLKGKIVSRARLTSWSRGLVDKRVSLVRRARLGSLNIIRQLEHQLARHLSGMTRREKLADFLEQDSHIAGYYCLIRNVLIGNG